MLPILVVVLLLVSGSVKLRASERAGFGLHAPSLLELLGGLGLAGYSVSSGAVGRGVAVASIAGVLLLVASSVHLASRLKHRSHVRGLTEGRRLETYLRYISSDSAPPPGGPSDP